jgi:C1A family cysteine protease
MKYQSVCTTIVLILFVYFSIIYADNSVIPHSDTEFVVSSNQSRENSPSSWLNSQGIPPVGDQVVAGSCYAWAAAYYYLTHLQFQEFGWDVTEPANQCSPAFVYNLTNGGVDNGAWEGDSARHDAFEVFETMGCATMEDMPYSYTGYRTFPSEIAFRNGMKFRTLSTHHISTRTDSGIQVLKNHLSGGNLAVLGILGYQNLNNISSYNNIYCVSQTTGGRLYWHEVTVVGYDDSLLTADGMGAFRIVNSWGTGWGESGYFWMSYEAVKHTKTSYGYAMYATDRIGYEPSYTTRMEVQHQDRYNLVYRVGYGNPTSPDTLVSFFEFSPMSLAVGIPYPGSAIVLDLSDIQPLMQGTTNNEIFLSIEDRGSNNGQYGYLNSLMIEDRILELCISSPSIPIPILDHAIATQEIINFDYSIPQPQNLTVGIDSLIGKVQLSWDAPNQPTGLTGYNLYLNGRRIDSTSARSYNHFLSLRRNQYYAVAAIYGNDESAALMQTVRWTGPQSFGIPFSDDFEDGFGDWYQVGTSGIPAAMVQNPVYEGQYATGLKTYPSDHTALARPFDTSEGADVETWCLLADYPATDGGGGIVSLGENGLIFGTFFDNAGHPGYFYTDPSYQQIPVLFDSLVTVSLNEWYKQKIWYCDGKLQFMLLDSNWNVMLNRVANLNDQTINQVALFALGLSGGWNFFDHFSISPWTYTTQQYFSPVSPTNNPYAILISDAVIDSVTLLPGDEIAIFDGVSCVGAVIVDGDWPLEINAWQADSTGPGFTPGNAISCRIWRAQHNWEYLTEITLEIGDGTFGNGIFSRFSLVGTQVVALEPNDNLVPLKYTIEQPYPNPFNPETNLEFSIPTYSKVEVRVYNILGQLVGVLAGRYFEQGSHKLTFNGHDLPSGFYFIHTNIEGKMERLNKVLLVK